MLKKFRDITYKYAILSAVIIALLFYLLMQGVFSLFSVFPRSTLIRYLEEIVGILISIGGVVLFGFATSFKAKGFFKGIICGMTIIVSQLFVFINFFANTLPTADTALKPWDMIVLGLVSVFGIGFKEECAFRATIQNVLAKKYADSIKGIWITAIVSALIFGLIHSLNILSGVDVVSAIIQSVTNVGIGLLFAAIYLRSGSIWALIFIHTLIDMAGLAPSVFLYQSEVEVISSLTWTSLIGGLIFALISIFLLRPSKCKEVLARLNTKCCE